ncbi:Maf-like protein [Neisseria elongata subsp. glycolytica ATCC 29315]|uniref:Maf-like protein n=1 Tax=Neisseria elongata subsp. glycolytica ATCC 29315 TaxID=546263 RepID=D4DP68_NEIEG|nr:Maf-like protein [Neisseria elongata subsp. glycolytica ATCC 29315]
MVGCPATRLCERTRQKMTAPLLYLASASPRRREILQNLGYRIERIAADIDETPLPQEDAAEYVQRLAAEKTPPRLPFGRRRANPNPPPPSLPPTPPSRWTARYWASPNRPNMRAKCCSPFPAAAIRCIPLSACITKAASFMH